MPCRSLQGNPRQAHKAPLPKTMEKGCMLQEGMKGAGKAPWKVSELSQATVFVACTKRQDCILHLPVSTTPTSECHSAV